MRKHLQTIANLRRTLAERFPRARKPQRSFVAAKRLTQGNKFEDWLNEGPPAGNIVEIVCTNTASASSLIIIALLRRAQNEKQFLAVVDSQDSFDPSAFSSDLLNRLLWVRCRNAGEAIRAADLLLRDDNVPMAILDLRLSPLTALRKIPSSVWYRFQRLLAVRTCALVVITPVAMVGSASIRLALKSRFSLRDLERTHDELISDLEIELLRSHGPERAENEFLLVDAG